MTDNITNRLEASPEKKDEFRTQMQERLLGRISGELQLPPVEQMRLEVETGVFSPESITVAQEMQARAEKLAAYDAEQAKLYQEKLEMGLLVGSGVKPDVKKIASHFVKKMDGMTTALKEVGEAAQKTTTAFRETGEKIGRVKKEYVPQPHLTHRPFKTGELQALRNQLNRDR